MEEGGRVTGNAGLGGVVQWCRVVVMCVLIHFHPAIRSPLSISPSFPLSLSPFLPLSLSPSPLPLPTCFTPYLPLVGDGIYGLAPTIMVPFQGERRARLQSSEGNWNFWQSSARMCVERCFGVMKVRRRVVRRNGEGGEDKEESG